MPRWEYRVITIDMEMNKRDDGHRETHKERDQRIEHRLLEMGKEGWELVSFVPAVTIVQSQIPWMNHAIFKRPSSEDELN